ncbi:MULTISPECIES: hypothetical protein [Brevibacterium]|uniref:Uncharacterized protein n=1 Tax=Brevibacterium antiquum CNRZ 918 TaxID=1255637 RepID=A0A2H1KYC2_9MICO|nr:MULTISPECIES: hypothetical protein [Brevibacterium]SMY04775.1 hypothetical protein BANT918_03161 [Brevibacterium antiquum CNRZ 918]HCG55736.1 hypothetical protein [Brevibacterium sp.]
MSTSNVRERPGTLPARLVKTAGLFLAISMVTFAAVNILANMFQHPFIMIVEAVVVGVPFLVAVGCAVGAVVAKIVQHNQHAPV